MSLKGLAANSSDVSKERLTDDELVQHCIQANDHSVDAYRAVRNGWDVNWATYNNQFDFSEKADWQSKNYLSKFKMAVRVTKAMMKQAIIKSDRFFGFTGLNESSREIEKDIEEALLRVFSQASFKEKKFAQAVFLGLLENLIIFKVYPAKLTESDDVIHDNQDTKFVISPVSAYDLRIDPKGRNRYVIHRIKMDLSDYRALVDQKVYTRESLDMVVEDFQKYDEDLKEKIRKGEIDVPGPESRKEVELLEYWGDIDDTYGERLYQNITYTVVNRRAVARRPIKNEYRHGKAPFVWGPIIEKYGSVYHEGYGDPVVKLAHMINETLNLNLDQSTAASIKAFTVNTDYLQNPTALKSGIYPGKTILTRGVPPGGKVVEEFSLGDVSQSTSYMLAALDREFQNNTGVNEFIGAFTGMGEKTATEVKQKSAQSMTLMQSIAEEIEDNVIEPLIEMVYSLVLQYNPEILGDRVMAKPMDQLRFKFKARGISKVLSQMEELQKLFMWINMVGQTPIGQKINWDKVADMSVRMISRDPKDLILQEQAQPQEVGQGATNPQLEQQAAQEANVIKLKQLMGASNG